MKRSHKRITKLTVPLFLAVILTGFPVSAKELPTATAAPDASLAAEAPAFSACVEYSWQGYVVTGTLTEIPSDISLI